MSHMVRHALELLQSHFFAFDHTATAMPSHMQRVSAGLLPEDNSRAPHGPYAQHRIIPAHARNLANLNSKLSIEALNVRV